MKDLIIIGGGPAGINCGIEASKAGLDYLILEKGLLVNSIYHFPTNMTFFSTSKKLEVGEIPFISHTEKPTRKEALEYYRRLVEHYRLTIQFRQEVNQVEKLEDGFLVKTADQSFKTKNVILAIGFYDTPRKLDIEGIDLPKVKQYYDDAHPYIGMNVIVIGGANSACDVALETWASGGKVTMVVRDKALYKGVKYWIRPNIENRIKEGSIPAYFNSTVTKVTEQKVYLNTPDGEVALDNDYVLAMVGYKPDYTLLNQLGVSLLGEDLIPAFNEENLETNVKGVFVAGVLNGGLKTNSLFIENTRDHGEKVVNTILSRQKA